MEQLPSFIASSRIIASKQYSAGSVYIVELTPEMVVVMAYKNLSEDPIYSRAYFYSLDTRKAILAQARRQFNYLKDCIAQKKLELIEEFD